MNNSFIGKKLYNFFKNTVFYDFFFQVKITKVYFSPYLINTIHINHDLLSFQIKKSYILSFLF